MQLVNEIDWNLRQGRTGYTDWYTKKRIENVKEQNPLVKRGKTEGRNNGILGNFIVAFAQNLRSVKIRIFSFTWINAIPMPTPASISDFDSKKCNRIGIHPSLIALSWVHSSELGANFVQHEFGNEEFWKTSR